MTTMYRIRSVWTGFTGAPGYTNLFWTTTDPLGAGAQVAADATRLFWNAIRSALPAVVTIQVESAVALIEDVTGEQQDELTLGTAPAAVGGILSERFASPAGCTVTWNTATFLQGRKVKGRTYLVPMTSSAFQNNGTIDDAIRTTIQTAADALISGPGGFVIFARPRPAQTAAESPTGVARPARVGASAGVTSARVADKSAVLTSCRD